MQLIEYVDTYGQKRRIITFLIRAVRFVESIQRITRARIIQRMATPGGRIVRFSRRFHESAAMAETLLNVFVWQLKNSWIIIRLLAAEARGNIYYYRAVAVKMVDRNKTVNV